VTIEAEHPSAVELAVLDGVQRRVLWLAAAIVHHANHVRPNRSGVKVGGHQASSASMVSLMTALWFAFLEAPDRVSVKPHASPVLHAINYLLGRLEPRYLETLRQFGGLQSYPSRAKDPDPVDYSTGSVGIGATAPIWGAIAHRYVAGHFDVPVGGRQIALLGDAELDEGACWEAIADPMVAHLGEVLWVVDLNRQSLDRVVPDIAAGRLASMFEAAGWHCVMAKHGPKLGAHAPLRHRVDAMPNEEYQRLLRADADELRRRLEVVSDELGDADLLATFRDLGGHDLGTLLRAYHEADAVRDRPSVVFAYTIKGWQLPTEGHPANHSALLNEEQYGELAAALGADPGDPWAMFEDGSPEAELCAGAARRLERPVGDRVTPSEPLAMPEDLGREHKGTASTQQAFGRFFVDLVREAPEVAERVVTVSPDVGTSTNLGGWINKAGIWSPGDRIDWFADDTDTLVRWRETDHGRHIELGIAEVNLVGLLGELGATWSRDGQPLLPVGTIYDPFVARALEPWSFGIYAGGQSILVGTPSGVTLGPEGGAHQSVITPSIGIEQPGCVAWEPAFGQDFEWTFLHALSRLGREDGEAAYFRLSTRPIDQSLHTGTRQDVLRGGYRLRALDAPRIVIAVMGALVPEAIEAADMLGDEAGIEAEIVCITSADLLFRSFQARSGLGEGDPEFLAELLPHDVPIVALADGHPHTLAFLGSPIACLGVHSFGQSGDLAELYEHHAIDAESVVGAALDLLD
jgi:pyruvate dehydrogenase E1 component